MEKDINLVYDGTFNGFLTAVYIAFDKQIDVRGITCKEFQQNLLFSDSQIIITNIEYAKKVWYGVHKINPIAMKTIYFAFLSEASDIPFILYNYIRKIVLKKNDHTDFPEGSVYRIYHLAELVEKKKRRIESSLKLQVSKDGVLYGVLQPEYNILPLLTKFFRSSFKEKNWLLYDSERNYGLYYNQKGVQLVSFHKKDWGISYYSSLNLETDNTPKLKWDSFFKNEDINALVSEQYQTHALNPSQLTYEHGREAV